MFSKLQVEDLKLAANLEFSIHSVNNRGEKTLLTNTVVLSEIHDIADKAVEIIMRAKSEKAQLAAKSAEELKNRGGNKPANVPHNSAETIERAEKAEIARLEAELEAKAKEAEADQALETDEHVQEDAAAEDVNIAPGV